MSATHESVKNFLGLNWTTLAENPDFNEKRQYELRKVLDRCASDTDYNIEGGETEGDAFKWFSMCVENGVGASISLNQSSTIRQNVLGWGY